MSEYRVRDTGEILTQGQLRRRFSNTSLPRTWGDNVHEALGIDPVLKTSAPEASSPLRVVVRDGLVQDSDGNWVANWIERDKFVEYTSEDGVVHTKADQEAEHQAALDVKAAEAIRKQRDDLIAATDYFALTDVTMDAAMTTYRQALRDITDHVNFPYLGEDDWPVKP